MSAPALSSSTPPAQRIVTQFIDGQMQTRLYHPSGLESELLKITPKFLQENGLNVKPWITYLENSIYPKHKLQASKSIQNGKDPRRIAALLVTEKTFNICFKELVRQLQALPCNSKDWGNRIPGLVEVTELVAILKGFFFSTRSAGTDCLNAFSRMMVLTAEESVEESVILHLQHLLIDRLSLDLNPNADYSFVVEETDKPWLAVKNGGVWQSKMMLDPEIKSFQYSSWPAASGLLPSHAALIKGTTIFRDTPFIALSFRPDQGSPEFRTAFLNRAPVKEGDIAKLSYTTETVYGTGTSSKQDIGNAVSFKGLFGPFTPNRVLPVSFDQVGQTLWNYAQLATEVLKSAWLEEIQTSPIKRDYTRILILPKTTEEVNERIIGALELALEAPEKNAPLIEWISNQYDFEYTGEEIKQAEQLAGIVLEAEEPTVTPAVIAHAIIQKIRKQSAAQKPKERSIQAEKSHSSHKKPLLSKEELKEQLSASSMSPKLKEQAIELLSGERLKSKREEDRFFFEIVRYQAKSNGASVQKTSSGGSHHSIKLVKQESASGKTTYRAATLVNKHGTDASRGHSLAAQQNNLLQLFTPLR